MAAPSEVIALPLRPPDVEVRLPIIQRQLTDNSRERKLLCTAGLTPETPRRYAELSARIDGLLDELAEALRERDGKFADDHPGRQPQM
jgi:hypothetical protein